MTKKLLSICFFLTIGLGAMAQNFSAPQPRENDMVLKKATDAYETLQYTAAIDALLQFKKKYPYYVPATEMLAESYRQTKNYERALHWYGQLVTEDKVKPEWALHYAEALANNEQYELSEQWYRKYLNLVPSDKRAQAFARTDVRRFTKNAADWRVFYTNINSPATEYSPIYYKNGLMFSSNRTVNSAYVFQWDRSAFTDLYFIDKLDHVRLDTVEIKEKTLMPARKLNSHINSSYHEGSAIILPEGSLMFTRNNYNAGRTRTSSTGVNKLKLFVAKGKEWDIIEEFPYNNDEYSVGHPALSPKGDVLIFVSDKKGGYGGTDLYYSVRTGPEGLWGKPVNMGPKINTEGDEMFPYWDKDNKLYFSSTGHPGIGGLDIFETTLRDIKPMYPPVNLGSPINSPADDFGMITNDERDKGFFSSNRTGNDDIYAFEHKVFKLTLSGLVIDALSRQRLSNSLVAISADGVTRTVTTDVDGRFNLELEKETDYDLLASKPGYLNNGKFLTTTGLRTDQNMNVVIELHRPKTDQQWVLEHCDSLKRIFQADPVYYDLDKYNIRPDAQPNLNKLVALMKAHPEMTVITSSHTDTRASVAYNKKLSLNRGNSVKSYLVSQGINAGRIRVEYYGKSHLVNNCNDRPCTEAMQQLNRRTEFEILVNGVNLTRLDCSK
ncbi:flagellar motor protein MotB [Pedobacter yulinensis]|uniref:Flagellar motor protein MotB n=1 Tax=Pedobacter yulinensis TaxID=2126353 RepID=A0A2T3HLT3_9SPHI|nr:OmpA family protein [Pedobacter yulinensis]PST83386.1 flagellar motor protein MotB [Pedobacter yulinensis]